MTCSNRDDWVGAEEWHRKALEAKLACGLNPVTVGVSYNSLGESLLENGKLEEAEDMLKKALEIRTKLGRGHLFDTAVTRENLAQLYQAMGKPTEANEARLGGEAKGEMCCSNYRVRRPRFTTWNQDAHDHLYLVPRAGASSEQACVLRRVSGTFNIVLNITARNLFICLSKAFVVL